MITQNKQKIRELTKEVKHLSVVECHIEARMKIAAAFNLFDKLELLHGVKLILRTEKTPPRNIEKYFESLTGRMMVEVKESYGDDIFNKLVKALQGNRNGNERI